MSLQLSDLGIADISPLSSLTSLGELTMERNAVSDLTPLAGLPIVSMFLADNEVTNVSWVASLPELDSLYLEGNPVASLAGLSSASLTLLHLEGVPLRDLSPLGSLSSLDNLLLRRCSITSIDGLATALDGRPLNLVDIRYNSIVDISPVRRIDASSIGANDNLITDLSGLVNLPERLEYFGVANNPIDCDAQSTAIANLRAQVDYIEIDCP